MKRFIFAFLLLLIASPVYPFGPAIQAVVSAGGAAVWTCTKGDAILDYVANDASTADISTTKSVGQKVVIASDMKLWGFDVRMFKWSNATATARIGAALDLGTYVDQVSMTGLNATGVYTFEFNDPGAKSTTFNGTYYLGILEATGDTGVRYASGGANTGITKLAEASTWVLGSVDTTAAMAVTIYRCAP
jgi:hypothetical protein